MVSSQSRFMHHDRTVIRSLVASNLIDFLVLFIREEGSGETLLGSGTLVSIDNRKAILTADHVLQKCEQPSGNVRLLFPTRFDNSQQFRSKSSTPIPIKNLEKRTIGRGNHPDSGPDLGVLIIPDPVSARFIPSTKTFYNLEKRRKKVVGGPRSIDTGIWVLAGAPAEWTEEVSDSDSGSARVNQQGSLLGLGVVNKGYYK